MPLTHSPNGNTPGSLVISDRTADSMAVPGENGAMWKFLRYITNNEATSRHEEVFDGIFWIIETLALTFGIWILLAKHIAEWIPFLVIEYCWAMDNLRHNRP